MTLIHWLFFFIAGMIIGWCALWMIRAYKARKSWEAASEIIGRDDLTGKPITRAELLKDLNTGVKRFSGNSHDRRVQRREYGRQEKTPMS